MPLHMYNSMPLYIIEGVIMNVICILVALSVCMLAPVQNECTKVQNPRRHDYSCLLGGMSNGNSETRNEPVSQYILSPVYFIRGIVYTIRRIVYP